jgi:hypothetical protein
MLLEKRFSYRESKGWRGLKFGRCLALEWMTCRTGNLAK